MISIKIISAKEYLKAHKKPNQKKIWDNIAKDFKFKDIKKHQITPIIKEFLKNKKEKIIDLGCGPGWSMIPNPNIEYYAVDFSKESVKLAKQYTKNKNINAKIFKNSITKLPKEFKDNMFDYGLFIATLHCLETPVQRKKALEEFYRVLKPDAQALISIWNSEDKRFSPVKNQGDIYMSWREQGKPLMRYYYLYSKKEFLDLLKNTGFKVLQVYSAREHDRFSKKNLIVRIKKP